MSTGTKKPDTPAQPKAPKAPAGPGPSTAVRILISIVVAFHVGMLFLYPMANSRTSPTVSAVANWPGFRWYAEPLYLNHGHGFFGPDPGPSFYIDYVVLGEDGQEIKKGTFPDKKDQFPRLRYHRYKMLADQLESPHPEAEQRRQFILTRYAQELIREYDGAEATVIEKMHNLVPLEEWLGDPERGVKPKSLDDESLYQEIARATQRRSDVEAADAKLLNPAPAAPTTPESLPGVQP
ncbi:hypothetical protein [Aeoliella sp. SH292]|uniref:hypothetical protein n=1 Tax=Aeoliella sp. SH292 TaxID=3454464 RepID=UPI003F966BFD